MDQTEYDLVKYALDEGTPENAILMRLTMLNNRIGAQRDEACRLANAYWQAVFSPEDAKSGMKAYRAEQKAHKAAEKELAENSASSETQEEG